MNIWKISLSNIFNKPLYAFLSVLLLSISIGLLLGIQELDTSIQYQFENSLGDIDMVLGAKGSPLQLVLASVLHIDNPTGNISLADARKVIRNPMIKKAVPISYGDNYKGYRIVGTTPDFTSFYGAELAQGRNVEKSMEVVLGSAVAQCSNLQVGDTFLSSHGLTENTIDVHQNPLTVVGIYKTTHKVIDRLIVTNLQSIWDVHHHHGEEGNENEGHHENHHEEEPEKEITSMLISFRNPMALLTMPRRINKQTSMQAALPKYELERLFNFTGVGVKAVSWIAYIILAISCITIAISLFKMVKERAFDLALMRTYGASNFQLVLIVACEAFILVLVSLIIGALLSQMGLLFAFSAFKDGYSQEIILKLPYHKITQSILLILAMTALSVTLAVIPVLRMNISKILSNEK